MSESLGHYRLKAPAAISQGIASQFFEPFPLLNRLQNGSIFELKSAAARW